MCAQYALYSEAKSLAMYEGGLKAKSAMSRSQFTTVDSLCLHVDTHTHTQRYEYLCKLANTLTVCVYVLWPSRGRVRYHLHNDIYVYTYINYVILFVLIVGYFSGLLDLDD